MATPRGPQWAVDPRPSRWRGAGWAVAWLVVLVACGFQDVRL